MEFNHPALLLQLEKSGKKMTGIIEKADSY